MKGLMVRSLCLLLALGCIWGSSTTYAEEPIDSANVPDPPDSLLMLMQAAGGITLPSAGTVEVIITKTETSSLEDVLMLIAPNNQTLTSNARNCVGCRFELGHFEAGEELVFRLDNQNPNTGPDQVTDVPRINGSSPLWTLNFEDWRDSDWDDVIAEVNFYPDTIVKVKEVYVYDDISLDGINDLVFRANYDQNGDLLSVDKFGPIADGMSDGGTAGKTRVAVELEGFPALPAGPFQVKGSWVYTPVGVGDDNANGDRNLNSSYEMDIDVPNQIGQYNLTLAFEIRDADGNYLSYNDFPGLTAYTTLAEPTLASHQFTLARLAQSVQWGASSSDQFQMANNLNDEIYSHGQTNWNYRDTRVSWQSLIDGTASQANCFSFAELWGRAGNILGSSRTRQAPDYFGGNNRGFLTKPATSMDGLAGNAGPCPSPVTIERWLFGCHSIGRLDAVGAGYYDPTFGKEYASLNGYVEWNIVGPDPATGITTDDGDHNLYSVSGVTATYPWGLYCYEDRPTGTFAIQSDTVDYIVGIVSDSGIDTNSDGLYEHLIIGVEVDIPSQGTYTLSGSLQSGGTSVSHRQSYWSSMLYLGETKECDSGITSFEFTYSGQEVFESGLDGPYTFDLYLTQEGVGLVDQASLLTSALDHTAFREVASEVLSISDYGEDLDGDGYFDRLAIEVTFDAFEAGSFEVYASGVKDSIYIGSAQGQAEAVVGSNTVTIYMDGAGIRESGVDGPYTISVRTDPYSGSGTSQKDFTTAAYTHGQFNRRPIFFTGNFYEDIFDTDSDWVFDRLTIFAEVDVEIAGEYEFDARLASTQASCQANNMFTVGEGIDTVEINFTGKQLYSLGENGPWKLHAVSVTDSAGNGIQYMNTDFETTSYSYDAFWRPSVAVTGNFDDVGWYSHIQPYWWLAVDVEVETGVSGYVSLSADLYSESGEYIVTSSALKFMISNYAQDMRLLFDGRRIYGNKEDGPYHLRNIVAFSEERPTEILRVGHAYTTSAWSYTDFSPAAIVEGSVVDGIGAPIEEADVFIPTWDSDLSDQTGNYRLSVLEDGNYTVKVFPPDMMEVDGWIVYVDGDSVANADSVVLDLTVGTVTQVDFKALTSGGGTGSIDGTVDGPSGGMLGVTVDLYDASDVLLETVQTDATGAYGFAEVETGDYTVSVVAPLGYTADPESAPVTVTSGLASTVDFELSTVPFEDDRRCRLYWRHQVSVLLRGWGCGQVTLEEMSGYMNQIRVHFNENAINPVPLFEVEQPATQTDSLQSLKSLLKIRFCDENALARSQLAALLLNVASEKLHQATVVSSDGATVSQAITYCYDLIVDGDPDNDLTATYIALSINWNFTLPADVIPLSTPNIAYKGVVESTGDLPHEFSLSANRPNPFNMSTEISFAVAEPGHVSIEVFNVLGRRVATLVDRYMIPGHYTVSWNGRSSSSGVVASGVYFYRFNSDSFSDTKKMLLLK